MPGQNLHKLNKAELEELRACVRKIYFADFSPEQVKQLATDREVDKLIDSLLPSTVEKCREQGMARGFISKKRFFLPSKILTQNGKPIMREDR